MNMAARLNLIIHNSGRVSTFRRKGHTGTIPDITMTTEDITPKIADWKVVEYLTGSDHQYIHFKFRTGRPEHTTRQTGKLAWNVAKLNDARIADSLKTTSGEFTTTPRPPEPTVCGAHRRRYYASAAEGV